MRFIQVHMIRPAIQSSQQPVSEPTCSYLKASGYRPSTHGVNKPVEGARMLPVSLLSFESDTFT